MLLFFANLMMVKLALAGRVGYAKGLFDCAVSIREGRNRKAIAV
jgi:hypothetical protein